MKRLAVVGTGKMGGTIFNLLRKTHNVSAVEKNATIRKHFTGVLSHVEELNGNYDAIIIAVKPSDAPLTAREMYFTEHNFKTDNIISVMAGVTTTTLSRLFPENRITRAMPNLTIGTRNGLTSIYSPMGNADLTVSLFEEGGGLIHKANSDTEIDLATCISASGPAYFLKMAEVMSAEAEATGLRRIEARMLARSALRSANIMSENGGTILDIASPGGTTEQGLNTLERYNFSSAITSALRKSLDRAIKLDYDTNNQLDKYMIFREDSLGKWQRLSNKN